MLSQLTVDQLEQNYILAPSKVKDAYLFQLLNDFREKKPNSSVIVFTNTCRQVNFVFFMRILSKFYNFTLFFD